MLYSWAAARRTETEGVLEGRCYLKPFQRPSDSKFPVRGPVPAASHQPVHSPCTGRGQSWAAARRARTGDGPRGDGRPALPTARRHRFVQARPGLLGPVAARPGGTGRAGFGRCPAGRDWSGRRACWAGCCCAAAAARRGGRPAGWRTATPGGTRLRDLSGRRAWPRADAASLAGEAALGTGTRRAGRRRPA